MILRIKPPIMLEHCVSEQLACEEDFPQHKFFYVEKGDCLLTTKGKAQPLSCGDFYLLHPHTPYQCQLAENASVICVSFACNYSVLNVITGKTRLNAEKVSLISTILTESQKSDLTMETKSSFGSQQLAKAYTEILLLQLLRERIQENPEIIPTQDNADEKRNCVKQITEILNENIYSSISLNDVQKNMYYSKTYLNGIFKKVTGMSIISYYRYLKIEEAKRLIFAGEKIVDVSNKLKFDTPNYFYKVFKDITGMTPNEYKKQKLQS